MEKILFFGDSITDMARNREMPTEVYGFGFGYVFLTVAELMLKYPDRFEYVNAGVGGDRTCDLLERLDKDVVEGKPDYVTILIGVNDVWHGLMDKSRGVSLKKYKENYHSIINRIQEALPNTKIIIMEPFLLNGSAREEFGPKFDNVFKYARAAKAIAKEYNLPFVPLQKELNKAEARNNGDGHFLLSDGVHPHLGGAKLISNQLLKCLYKNYIK